MINLNINTKQLNHFAAKLEQYSDWALPVAIRGALNDAAYDMKVNTMPSVVLTKFITRKENFFKANSTYQKAEGFNVKTMKSTVGFISDKLNNQKGNFAVQDLKQQEEGGQIQKKTMIPFNAARGGSSNKPVRANDRLTAIKNAKFVVNAPGSDYKQKFIKTVIFAGVGGYVIGGQTNEVLFRVDSINDGSFKLTGLYSFKKGRSVDVEKTNFMKEAGDLAGESIEEYFIKRAEKTLNK